MITYVQGDLFTSPAQVLVNTVNTVGVMGKGIAKEFKAIYPEMFRVYQGLCEREELTIGKLFLYRTPHKWILNFPTKRHWRQRSRVGDIEAGLKTFVERYAEHGLHSVAFPQLGCGNGELDWETQVRPLMERYLGPLPIDIFVHIYAGGQVVPEHRDRRVMRVWLRAEPGSLPFSEVWDDLMEFVAGNDHGVWQVARDDEGRAVALRFAGQRDLPVMPKEDLFDLWQRFRAFGYLSRSDVPKEHEAIADPILDLLETLPYVEGVRLAAVLDNGFRHAPTMSLLNRETARGLRLVPPPAVPSLATAPLMMGDTTTMRAADATQARR
jgi:O-acetyl-ADP-ribose deacetylase (regulator of RNase III)